ncbi:unnamed protein product [Thlaspi arvense]|uniref:Protein TIFY n=1 Tax=Thlaspi arvense TaxID=13288 RepID=A0AAU9RFW0_THLAR|nr:unnamed protein product [Thlaspi arvense]
MYRYLKEKGSFGNIDIGLVRKPDSSVGLSGNPDPSGTFSLPLSRPPALKLIEIRFMNPEQDVLAPEKRKQQNVMHKADSETKLLDVIQRVSKGEHSTSSGGKATDTNLSVSEAGSSQLTIFFGGRVFVYNEFPDDKAKEIMEVAKQAKPVTDITIQTPMDDDNNNNKSNMVLPDLNEPTDSADLNQQQQHQNQLVERIARRASLHRFFAKRKDRAVARAPYQVNQNAGHHDYPNKPETAPGQPLEPGHSSKRPENSVAQTMSLTKPEGDKDICMEIEEVGQCSRHLELRL